MNDMRRYSKEFLCEFIELYRSLPSLWNVKSREYSNRVVKANDYETLINKWKEVEPDADRDFVVKKINNIRSCYRRERKRVRKDQLDMNGVGVSSSHLWYYPLLSFLEGQEIKRSSMLSLYSEGHDEVEFPKGEATAISPAASPSPSNISFAGSKRNRKRRAKSSTRQILNDIHAQLKKPVTYDKYYHTAISWAETMRDLPQDQQIFATKLINDTLYEAQLNTLSRESCISVANVLGTQGSYNNNMPSQDPISSPHMYAAAIQKYEFSDT